MCRRRTRAAFRIRQGLRAIWRTDPLPAPERLTCERQLLLFDSLSPHDRHHLGVAYESALDRTDDPDVQLAALLHDLGKVTLSGKRISLPARVIAVLGNHVPSKLRERLRPKRSGAWLTGPWLAEHHARLGAERLRALGVREDVCWLVENHDDYDIADRRLELLREIDSSTL